MIKHIVMWKLKDFAEGGNKLENAKKIKDGLEGLNGKISEIKSIEVGINAVQSPAAYDVVLVSEFENLDDLNSYQVNPKHVAVAGFIGKVKEDRIVVDYEL